MEICPANSARQDPKENLPRTSLGSSHFLHSKRTIRNFTRRIQHGGFHANLLSWHLRFYAHVRPGRIMGTTLLTPGSTERSINKEPTETSYLDF
jgi:hypothetical protein